MFGDAIWIYGSGLRERFLFSFGKSAIDVKRDQEEKTELLSLHNLFDTAAPVSRFDLLTASLTDNRAKSE